MCIKSLNSQFLGEIRFKEYIYIQIKISKISSSTKLFLPQWTAMDQMDKWSSGGSVV